MEGSAFSRSDREQIVARSVTFDAKRDPMFADEDGNGWVPLARFDELHSFVEWLVSMDDPEDVRGREERRTVTLTKIIDRARAIR